MEIENFRIGNYYQSDKYVKQVEPYTFDCYKHEGIEPVILTEEWLVKFGFKEHFLAMNCRFFRLGDFELQNHREYDDDSDIICYDEIKNKSLYLPYVHQLQNIYFTVTGQELVTNKEDK